MKMSESKDVIEIDQTGEKQIHLTFEELEALLDSAAGVGWAVGAAGDPAPKIQLRDMREPGQRGSETSAPLSDIGLSVSPKGDD